MEYTCNSIYKYVVLIFIIFMFILNQELCDNYFDVVIMAIVITWIIFLINSRIITKQITLFKKSDEYSINNREMNDTDYTDDTDDTDDTDYTDNTDYTDYTLS